MNIKLFEALNLTFSWFYFWLIQEWFASGDLCCSLPGVLLPQIAQQTTEICLRKRDNRHMVWSSLWLLFYPYCCTDHIHSCSPYFEIHVHYIVQCAHALTVPTGPWDQSFWFLYKMTSIIDVFHCDFAWNWCYEIQLIKPAKVWMICIMHLIVIIVGPWYEAKRCFVFWHNSHWKPNIV